MESKSPSCDKSDLGVSAPPRGRRQLVLGGLALLGMSALAVALALMPAARFSLASGAPAELGNLKQADLTSAAEWVRGKGRTSAEAISFRRQGKSGSFRLTQIAARPELWVVLPVPRAVESNYVPPKLFQGRLLPVNDLGLSNRPVARLIEQSNKGGKYVLFQGETPQSQRDSLWAALFLSVVGVSCLITLARLLQKVPESPQEDA